MSRRNRIALLAAAALLVALTGTVFATRQPDAANEPAQLTQDGEEEAPSAEKLAQVAERLGVESQVVSDLAAEHGLAGAVRLIAWSAEKDIPIAEIETMRAGDGTEEGRVGWGRIAKDLGVHPGIGSIMGNGQGQGQGRENAPGQNREEDDESGG